jgi:hypothetical protein
MNETAHCVNDYVIKNTYNQLIASQTFTLDYNLHKQAHETLTTFTLRVSQFIKHWTKTFKNCFDKTNIQEGSFGTNRTQKTKKMKKKQNKKTFPVLSLLFSPLRRISFFPQAQSCKYHPRPKSFILITFACT